MTTYQPRYRVTGSQTWINFGSPLSSSTFTATVTGLAASTQYDFDILEIDSFGSTPSATVTTTTLATTATESTEGTEITQSNYTTQKIYDASLIQWSMTSGFQVASSPSPYSTVTTDTNTSAVTEILYHNHTVFYENSSNDWFYWTGADPWVPTIDLIGPITVGGLTSPTFTVGSTGIVIGALAVATVGSPSFSGSFSITGTDSAYFTITSGHLVTAQTTTARTYSISITATEANVVGSPLTTAFSIAGSASLESAEGYTVTTVGPIVYASETMGVADVSGPWNTFQLTSGALISQSINGGAATTVGGDLIALVYHNHTLFQHAGDGSTFDSWWYWDTATSAYVQFYITAIGLSNSTIGNSQPVNTVIGTLSATMSDSSTFVGTYGVSDTTHFKIVGSSLETNVANLSGSYPITITAMPSVVGDSYVSAYGASPGQTFTIVAGTSSFASPPAQAVAAGFTTLSFFDDFTTNTITGNASITTMQTGINWYPGQNAGNANITDPTNYHLQTAATAASISNGNTSGGSNASPNGGILSIFGSTNSTNQGTFNGVPQALIGTSYAGPAGLWGPTGYWEGYFQRNSAETSHMNFWTNPIDYLTCLELDIMEVQIGGNPHYYLGNLNEHVNGTITANQDCSTAVILSDSEWHTVGVLVAPTTGGQCTVTAYLDNVAVGSVTAGTGTNFPLALTNTRFFSIGTDFSTQAFNFDWIRYWS